MQRHNSQSSINKQHYLLLIVIIILGFAVRIAYLDRDMRFDESQTVYLYAQKSLSSIVADYTAPNNHIFHTIFVHFTFKYLDMSPPFVRLPALIAGILLIPMSFVVAKRLYNTQTGLICSALVAITPILIDYSVNARGYSFLALIVMWMLYLVLDLLKKPTTGKWLLFSVLAALGFLTIPIFLYAMGFIALWFLVNIWRYHSGEERRTLLKNYIVSMILGAALTLVLYTPVIIFSGIDLLINNDVVQALPSSEYYPQFWRVFADMWTHITWGFPAIALIFLVIAFIIGIFGHRRTANDNLSLVPFILIWIIPILLVQRVFPFDRTWYFLVPIACLLTANGISYILGKIKLDQKYLLNGIILLIVFVMTVHIAWSGITGLSHHPDAEKAAFTLDEVMTPNDVVVMYIPSNYVVFYYSLLNDLPLGTSTLSRATEANLATTNTGYMYIFYHINNGDSEYNHIHEFVGDELNNAEIVYEWEHSILLRVVREE